jgi:hypothetical protein
MHSRGLATQISRNCPNVCKLSSRSIAVDVCKSFGLDLAPEATRTSCRACSTSASRPIGQNPGRIKRQLRMFRLIFRPPGPTLGTGSPENGSGSKTRAGCTTNQPRRPILTPVCGYSVLGWPQKEKYTRQSLGPIGSAQSRAVLPWPVDFARLSGEANSATSWI